MARQPRKKKQTIAEKKLIENYKTIYASCSGKLYCDYDLPEWQSDWINWTRMMLCPDWTIYVNQSDNPSPDSMAVDGICDPTDFYLIARITIRRGLEETDENKLTLIHEVIHAFFGKMNSSMTEICSTMAGLGNENWAGSRLLGTNCLSVPNSIINHSVIGPLFNLYTNAEEETTVRLSRILFRIAQLLSKEEGKPPCLF
jgi:hypothetical protein